jgi:hypothetical protein
MVQVRNRAALIAGLVIVASLFLGGCTWGFVALNDRAHPERGKTLYLGPRTGDMLVSACTRQGGDYSGPFTGDSFTRGDCLLDSVRRTCQKYPLPDLTPADCLDSTNHAYVIDVVSAVFYRRAGSCFYSRLDRDGGTWWWAGSVRPDQNFACAYLKQEGI